MINTYIPNESTCVQLCRCKVKMKLFLSNIVELSLRRPCIDIVLQMEEEQLDGMQSSTVSTICLSPNSLLISYCI